MFDIFKRIKRVIEHRELLIKLASKDLKVRYKHPFLGFLWALLVPLFMITVFRLVFSIIIKINIENYPFFVFLMTAMFPWNYFNLSVSTATMSILDSSSLIKKVYFPREIVPISIVVANLMNFLLSLAVMLIFLVFFRIRFTPLLIFLPAIVLFQTIFTIGIVLISAGLQVHYRDIKYIVGLLLMVWFYLTPIFYPLMLVANISKTFLRAYMFNPFVGLITLYRIVLIGGYSRNLPPEINVINLSIWTAASCIVTFLLGFLVFRRYESRFADLV